MANRTLHESITTSCLLPFLLHSFSVQSERVKKYHFQKLKHVINLCQVIFSFRSTVQEESATRSGVMHVTQQYVERISEPYDILLSWQSIAPVSRQAVDSNPVEASDFFSGLSLQLHKFLNNCEDHFHFYSLSAVPLPVCGNVANLEYRTIRFFYRSDNFFCFVLQIGCIPTDCKASISYAHHNI